MLIFGGKSSYLDCLYMTVISLTTVGYGEVLGITGNPRAQIFTMLLITFGMGIILYSISTVTAMLIEGELTGMLRRRKMENKIKCPVRPLHRLRRRGRPVFPWRSNW